MKNNIIRGFFLCIVLTMGIISCKQDVKKREAEKIVEEWTGREIIFPTGIPCSYLGRDTVCPDQNTPYKILLYTDSTGCTDCKLQLHRWNDILKEIETDLSNHVSLFFYFQPKDEKELNFLLRRDHFTQAVYMDKENRLHEANRFPGNMSYQCFLLDRDNKVLLIGNPILNPKIWELYRQTVMSANNTEQKNISHTTVEIEQTEIELPNTGMHKPSTAIFILKNTGDVPLLIKDISTSCGCTIAEWNRKPIKPRDKTEIKVKVTPDAPGYLRKTVTVFCNTKKGTIPLTVKSIVKE